MNGDVDSPELRLRLPVFVTLELTNPVLGSYNGL